MTQKEYSPQNLTGYKETCITRGWKNHTAFKSFQGIKCLKRIIIYEGCKRYSKPLRRKELKCYLKFYKEL